MRKPSMRQAEWIHSRMAPMYAEYSVDDVYDVLLFNITQPYDFYAEVQTWAIEYEFLLDQEESRAT